MKKTLTKAEYMKKRAIAEEKAKAEGYRSLAHKAEAKTTQMLQALAQTMPVKH